MSNATRFAYVVHQFINGISFYLVGDKLTERLEEADIFNTMEEADLACDRDGQQAMRVSLAVTLPLSLASLSPLSPPETAQKPVSTLALPASPDNAKRKAKKRESELMKRAKSGEKIWLLNGTRIVDIVVWGENDSVPFRSVALPASGMEWNVWDLEETDMEYADIPLGSLFTTSYQRTN